MYNLLQPKLSVRRDFYAAYSYVRYCMLYSKHFSLKLELHYASSYLIRLQFKRQSIMPITTRKVFKTATTATTTPNEKELPVEIEQCEEGNAFSQIKVKLSKSDCCALV